MKIGLIVAMDKEFEVITQAWLPQNPSLRTEKEKDGIRLMRLYPSENDEVILLRSGIGKVNAALASMMLIDERVNCIISSGVAGGAFPLLSTGSMVVGSTYRYHDVYCGKEVAKGQVQGEPAVFYADEKLLRIAEQLRMENTKRGAIVSGDQFVDNKQTMGKILDEFPDAVAVDMESCAIAQVCHKKGIPFISFRMISDVVLNPVAQQYEDFWNKAPLQMASNSMCYVMKVLSNYKPFS